MIEEIISSDMEYILNNHGVSLNIYFSPVYTTDSEGGATTITLGTATSATGLVMELTGEEISNELEGIDLKMAYRVYFLSSVGTIEEDDIIEYNNERYRIVSISRYPIDSVNINYYGLIIERIQGATYA